MSFIRIPSIWHWVVSPIINVGKVEIQAFPSWVHDKSYNQSLSGKCYEKAFQLGTTEQKEKYSKPTGCLVYGRVAPPWEHLQTGG
jgi:hypothetical protein